ncbi:MAG: 3-phosphoshikimate 1-carboxyvinyltransferase [Firmicutes bacterium]|nr:3-phosphoshikimate 1-carboxyvinyltransferase [Bacillota bacterium]
MRDKVIREAEYVTLPGGPRAGQVSVPSSKSQLHRLLICATLGERPVEICYKGLSEDIRATANCLNALGAKVETEEAEDGSWGRLLVTPVDRTKPAHGAVLHCGESGTTLRFLLPVVGMLGTTCLFIRAGRLPERPLAPFDEQLRIHGMTLDGEGSHLTVSGALRSGEYALPGNISSQYVSGLLMAFSGLAGPSRLRVEGRLESSKYIEMTEAVLRQSGIVFSKNVTSTETVWTMDGGQTPALPKQVTAEGDWSAAVNFLCMGALSAEGVLVQGLNPDSVQPDKAILEVLHRIGATVEWREQGVFVRKGKLQAIEFDASQNPDVVPALAALLSLCEGTSRIYHAERLRLKESDRIKSTVHLLRSLSGIVTETADGLLIQGRPFLDGGTADPSGDHRIAMAAAVAACGCKRPVQVLTPRCVAKSYPRFWDDLEQL